MSAESRDTTNVPLQVITSSQKDGLEGTRNGAFITEEEENHDGMAKSCVVDDNIIPRDKREHNDVPDGPLRHILRKKRKKANITYGVNDRPPWHMSIMLAFQHFLTMFGAHVSIPLILAPQLCIGNDLVLLSQLIGTTFFVSGLVTILQSTFGVRLPIIQGGTFAFLSPTFAILSLQGDCPPPVTVNSTQEEKENATEAVHIRLREIQGAVMTASCIQVFIGFTGIVGWLLKFIGPLTIAPTIALIGVTLFGAAADRAGLHWGMAALTIALIIGFSQYLPNVNIPCCGRDKVSGKWKMNKKFPIFKLFPIILGILTSWLIAYILTATEVFPSNPNTYGFFARTDLNAEVLREAPWFRFPYPGQWGLPTVSTASALGMIAGVLASMIESLGDYYACARLSGAPPPPAHAINRAVGMEGIGCIIAGAWGTANGSTSYSENVGAIGITKVGSRLVVQIAGCLMLIFGLFTKFSALFTTIPDPIIGGVFCVMFGMVAAVGLSNLQFVELNSTRNLCVLGFSFFMGLVVPYWMADNTEIISTGIVEIDQLITVLLSTGMFVGGVFALVLDNTMPGTATERGISKWREEYTAEDSVDGLVSSVYDLPFGMDAIRRNKWTQYLPFSPTYRGFQLCDGCCKKKSEDDDDVENRTGSIHDV